MEEGPHCPDASYAHKDAKKHGVIVEVSNSQKRRDLKYLADDYILGSHGLTQLVIGIDLEYQQNKGKEARVIVWRPKDVEKDGEIHTELFILTIIKLVPSRQAVFPVLSYIPFSRLVSRFLDSRAYTSGILCTYDQDT
ncbi:hypothetical protein B0T25DRAFT_149202 [Lasiosphaeria hispida]|uniref:Uncharacterized protein n=1 Tax=Lasiosphaeria hispida TaxID=260671 RepID=A0AAJ0MFW9_9PEZI|nr:hypothetical protein B0T25DRAFT_149202 [Lasiosphaeria hispida]